MQGFKKLMKKLIKFGFQSVVQRESKNCVMETLEVLYTAGLS